MRLRIRGKSPHAAVLERRHLDALHEAVPVINVEHHDARAEPARLRSVRAGKIEQMFFALLSGKGGRNDEEQE